MRAHIEMAGATAGPEQVQVGGDHVALAAELLGHLADPTRLHLLRLLTGGERDVTALTAGVAAARSSVSGSSVSRSSVSGSSVSGSSVSGSSVSRSSVSQHLGRLRLAGLVHSRRDGRRMLYRLSSDHVGALVEEACQFAAHVVGDIPHHLFTR